MKKYLSLLLSLTLCMTIFVFSASAAGETAIGPSTPITGNGDTYKATSILYVTTGNKFKAATRVERTASSILPGSSTIKYQARLYNNLGALQLSSSVLYGSGDGVYPLAETGEWSNGTIAYSQGWIGLIATNGESTETLIKPTDRINLGRSSTNSEFEIQEIMAVALDSNGQYPINHSGESYGPCILADIVGEEPDLISAVGENGLEGFVRAKELCADYDIQPDEVVFIPLYDVNGIEIGSFALNSNK